MAAGPNMPLNKRGRNIIMKQGHTAGLYGMDPEEPSPVPTVGDEPRELKP